ncbi:MAG: molybdopterin-guanine dinucleotide biosynthesis protein B [Burkholderiaceae bacterium]|jgi:molybdopterin-guanine dinucleotide biosynthesis protein B|nr:molybdopterin-guanine dinucleotide biosynthesis protein B [Burkholderiaceae bacterium]
MKVIAITGYSGAGKTQLIEQLIPALKARGLRVSTVKHAHHRFDIDHPGKDTFRHRTAGAAEVLIASRHRLALVREFEHATELSAQDLLAELSGDADWVLLEGFRGGDLPKLEVWRAACGQPAHYGDDPLVVAVVTDAPNRLPRSAAQPVLDLNAPETVAAWLVGQGGRFGYSCVERLASSISR